MAYGDTFHPAGAARDIKVRGPLWAGLWSLTGIYTLFWLYFTAKDLSAYGNAKGRDLGQNPTMTLLAFLFGWILLFIPSIIALYRLSKRVQEVQKMNNVQPYNGWLALVLYLVISPAYVAYVQSELNKAWAVEGGPVPGDDFAKPLPAAPSTGDPLTQQQPQQPSDVSASPERPGA